MNAQKAILTAVKPTSKQSRKRPPATAGSRWVRVRVACDAECRQ